MKIKIVILLTAAAKFQDAEKIPRFVNGSASAKDASFEFDASQCVISKAMIRQPVTNYKYNEGCRLTKEGIRMQYFREWRIPERVTADDFNDFEQIWSFLGNKMHGKCHNIISHNSGSREIVQSTMDSPGPNETSSTHRADPVVEPKATEQKWRLVHTPKNTRRKYIIPIRYEELRQAILDLTLMWMYFALSEKIAKYSTDEFYGFGAKNVTFPPRRRVWKEVAAVARSLCF